MGMNVNLITFSTSISFLYRSFKATLDLKTIKIYISKMSFLRNPTALFSLNLTTLLGLAGSTYLLRSHMIELSEDHDARMVIHPHTRSSSLCRI
jgi:hypothetical protein